MTSPITPAFTLTTTTTPTATGSAPKTKPKVRQKWTAAKKARCLARFRESKLSQSAFADQRGVAAANLSRWLRQEPPASRAAKAEGSSFLEVPASVLSLPEATPLVIHWPGGARLEVVPGTDPAWLGQLLGSLRPCSV